MQIGRSANSNPLSPLRPQATLDLSATQLERMSGARRDFLAELGTLLQQRRALNAVIQASVPAQCDNNVTIVREHGKVWALKPRRSMHRGFLHSRLSSALHLDGGPRHTGPAFAESHLAGGQS